MERANGTLQDRLDFGELSRVVKELGLAKVGGIERANRWLDESGFFDELSSKFAVEPMDNADAHRAVVMDLASVLCVKEKRSVSNDGCVQWEGRTLQLRGHRAGLRIVEVWEQADGSLKIIDGGKQLEHGPWVEPPKVRKPVVNNKRHKSGPHQQITFGSKSATIPSKIAKSS